MKFLSNQTTVGGGRGSGSGQESQAGNLRERVPDGTANHVPLAEDDRDLGRIPAGRTG